jgi:hypothetical protein
LGIIIHEDHHICEPHPFHHRSETDQRTQFADPLRDGGISISQQGSSKRKRAKSVNFVVDFKEAKIMSSRYPLTVYRDPESVRPPEPRSRPSSTRLDTWAEVEKATTRLARASDYSGREKRLLEQQNGDVTVLESAVSRGTEEVASSDTSSHEVESDAPSIRGLASTSNTNTTILLCSKDNLVKFEVPMSWLSGRLLALARSSLIPITEIEFEESIGAVWLFTRFLHGDRPRLDEKARWELQCERTPALAVVPWNVALVDGVKLAKTVVDAEFEVFILELMKTLKA